MKTRAKRAARKSSIALQSAVDLARERWQEAKKSAKEAKQAAKVARRQFKEARKAVKRAKREALALARRLQSSVARTTRAAKKPRSKPVVKTATTAQRQTRTPARRPARVKPPVVEMAVAAAPPESISPAQQETTPA